MQKRITEIVNRYKKLENPYREDTDAYTNWNKDMFDEMLEELLEVCHAFK